MVESFRHGKKIMEMILSTAANRDLYYHCIRSGEILG